MSSNWEVIIEPVLWMAVTYFFISLNRLTIATSATHLERRDIIHAGLSMLITILSIIMSLCATTIAAMHIRYLYNNLQLILG